MVIIIFFHYTRERSYLRSNAEILVEISTLFSRFLSSMRDLEG